MNKEKGTIKRATNFSKHEETQLLQLVRKYATEVECKKSDTNTNHKKSVAWHKICQEYNGDFENVYAYRDASTLKRKYENLKKTSKKKYAEEKKCIYQTGGGPSKHFENDHVDNEIAAIISTQLTGLDSEFDTDCVDDINKQNEEDSNTNDGSTPAPATLLVPHSPEISCDESHHRGSPTIKGTTEPTCSENIVNWSKYTPDMLHKHKSTALKVGRKVTATIAKSETTGGFKRTRNGDLKTKLGQWAASKNNYVDAQRECFMKEQELKLEYLKEKYKLDLQQTKEIHAATLRHMDEEHRIKIEVLCLQKEKLLN